MSYLGKQPAFNPLSPADITTALGFTPIQLSSLSATQNLTYNSSTGQFTGPDLSSYLTSATASSTYLPLAGGTMTGNLTFSGLNRRITGDFSSNNPITDRILVQTSTTNGNTLFSILPNGTSTTTRYVAFNNSDPTNSGALQLEALSTDVRIQSFANGTGTAIPLLLMMGGTTVATVGTNGNFGIGITPASAAKLHVYGSEARLEGSSVLQSFYNGASTRVAYIGGSDTAFQINTDAASPIELFTNGTKRFTVGASGQFGIGVTPSYGTSGQAFISGGSGAAPSWGTLGVAGGGTGVATLTGLVKGNGTSAFTAATAGTDYGAPGTASTWTASQRGTVTTANSGSFDMSLTNNFLCTPTAGVTLTFTNITAGQSGLITLVNPSAYTISKAAAVKMTSTGLATISTAGTYLLSYHSPDGTNVYVSNVSGAMS